MNEIFTINEPKTGEAHVDENVGMIHCVNDNKISLRSKT